ncbi:MAG: class I SAM-dependent methyltransferase [Cyanobacteria bacterium P01_C01_bin.89]
MLKQMENSDNQWRSPAHALHYLSRADKIPHRTEGEALVLELVPKDVRKILDLGTGNGRLLALLKIERPQVKGIGLDLSRTMLGEAGKRFEDDDSVSLVQANMDEGLPDIGDFDAIVSSFAIHHCEDDRKRTLYGEIFDRLRPGGVFCNLEHVSSPTETLHRKFLLAIGYPPDFEDPSNKLLDVETQLQWFREIGFQEVDCYWKWREMALLAGYKPAINH